MSALRRRFKSWFAVAAVASLALATVPVKADDFGTGGAHTGWLADNATHTYCYFDFSMGDAAEFAMETSIEADTQVTSVKHDDCLSTTDIFWRSDINLDPDVRGETQCMWFSPPNTCLSYDVRLDKDEIDKLDDDWYDRRKTACHEAGHSLGLNHGDNKSDCMINGEVPSQNSQWRRFNEHHIGHINDAY
jgi:hypothetical protein